MISKTLDPVTLHQFMFLIRSMFTQEDLDIAEYWFQVLTDD